MSKRIQDLTSPLTRVRKVVWETFSKPVSYLSPNQRFWLGFAVLCLFTTLLIYNPLWRYSGEQTYKVNEIARESIIAPADIYFKDDEETERLRQAARETVKPMFMFESKRSEEALQSFRSAWENLDRKAAGIDSNRANSNVRSESQWTGAGGADLGKVFTARRFSTNELDAITRLLRENTSGDIYSDQDRPFLKNEIAIIDRQRPNSSREVKKPETTMIAVSEARNRIREGLVQIKSLSEKEVEAFYSALSPLVQPSVIFDSDATESSREEAARSVLPKEITLKRGERIVDEGKPVTSEILSKISAVRNYSSSNRGLNRFIGLLILICGLFWAAWKFIEHRGIVPRLALSEQKTFALFGFIILVQTALVAIFFRLADFTANQNVKAPLSDPTMWSLAIPFAFGSLLVTLLADRRTALFTGLFNALIAGFMAPRPLEFAVYAAIVSSVAVYGIGRYRTRQTITIAGALVGLSSAGLAIALIFYSQQPFVLNSVLLSIACALASGIITAAITSVFMPVCETFFGILTDVKLLELSNADLPALGQLALRAPGTNQHSHAVGQLAEEACRVVGGNGLLARIGALYHDIGKTAAPEHFVENQLGRNPHDRLKPAQSAKIIISHVTYGVKLAREMGLPSRIVDFIPQHHGTRTLHYFLKKAQEEARPDEQVVENDFRYPGPKPQFREAAIMMIADSCEAAARSLAEPTPENIRFIVTKIIDAILSDDQLNECDLTLRELTQIRESMIKSLVAIYHSRVDYPGYVPPATSSPKITIPEGVIDSEERGMRYKNPADIPISKGGEIEDEAINRSGPPDKADARSG